MMSFSSMTRAAASSSVQFKVHSSHDIGSRCRAPQKVFQFSPIRQRLGVKGAFVEAIEGGAQAGGKLLHLCDCITFVTGFLTGITRVEHRRQILRPNLTPRAALMQGLSVRSG